MWRDRRVDITKQITPIILCGGLGTRIRSVIGNTPKSLAKINNEPFIYYLLDQLTVFERIVIAAGYGGDQIEETVKQFSDNICISREVEPLGTGGAVKLALSKIKTPYILILNGDTYLDLRILINTTIKMSSLKQIMFTKFVQNVQRYGEVVCDSNTNKIIKFEEKGGAMRPGQVNIGASILSVEEVANISDNIEKFSLEEFLIMKMVSDRKLTGVDYVGPFLDIGIPEDFFKASSYIAENSIS